MLPDIDTFYSTIAEQIKFERIKKKINQHDLAKHLGLSRASMINIETGRHRPSVYQLMQIAIYLKIDYSNLIPQITKSSNHSKKKIKVNIKKAVLDEGTLVKSQETAVQNFLSDIKLKES